MLQLSGGLFKGSSWGQVSLQVQNGFTFLKKTATLELKKPKTTRNKKQKKQKTSGCQMSQVTTSCSHHYSVGSH